MNDNANHISRNFPIFSIEECNRLDAEGYRVGDCSLGECTSGIRIVVVMSDGKTLCTACNKELWAAYMVASPSVVPYGKGFHAAARIHSLVKTFEKGNREHAPVSVAPMFSGADVDRVKEEHAAWAQASGILPHAEECADCGDKGRRAATHRQGVDLLLNSDGVCLDCHEAGAELEILTTLGRDPFYNCEFALVRAQDTASDPHTRLIYAISAIEFAAVVVSILVEIGGDNPAPVTVESMKTAKELQKNARAALHSAVRAQAQIEAERAREDSR